MKTMKKSDYVKTFILVALVLCFLLPKAFGSFSILFMAWFIVWLLYNAVRIVLKADERKTRAVRIAIWFATVLLVGTMQIHWESSARDDADKAARAILGHKAHTGAYPQALADAGIDEKTMQREISLSYKIRDGKPALYYPAVLMPLSVYSFDFDEQRWRLDSY